jgi:hypothetical protein
VCADEVVPRKLAETKKWVGQRIIQIEFGGQHAALLCVPREQNGGAAPAAAAAAAAAPAAAANGKPEEEAEKLPTVEEDVEEEAEEEAEEAAAEGTGEGGEGEEAAAAK